MGGSSRNAGIQLGLPGLEEPPPAPTTGTRVANLYKEPYDIYVGRRGKGEDGYFGNPCVVGSPCPVCQQVHKFPRETLPCFEEYARRRIGTDPQYKERVGSLHGKTLGCFCKPKPCHGDILARLADELACLG